MPKRFKIGTVAVDSGTIVITDPCYADRAVDLFDRMDPMGKIAMDIDGLSLLVGGFGGDGVYDIYAEVETWVHEGQLIPRVRRVTVEFPW